jgi:transposase
MSSKQSPEFDEYDLLLINDTTRSSVRAQGCSFRGLWTIISLQVGTVVGHTRLISTEYDMEQLNAVIDLKQLRVLIL